MWSGGWVRACRDGIHVEVPAIRAAVRSAACLFSPCTGQLLALHCLVKLQSQVLDNSQQVVSPLHDIKTWRVDLLMCTSVYSIGAVGSPVRKWRRAGKASDLPGVSMCSQTIHHIPYMIQLPSSHTWVCSWSAASRLAACARAASAAWAPCCSIWECADAICSFSAACVVCAVCSSLASLRAVHHSTQ